MNRCIRSLAFVVASLVLSPFAHAITVGGPVTGLWYDANEPGRGFNIELQGDTMAVTTYIYDDAGAPLWYLSTGTYDQTTGIFTGTYDSYSDGQCFGCTWVAPILHQASGGPITITFQTNQTAVLTYDGGSVNIAKINYGYGNKTDMLYGEWAFTYNDLGTVDGDWIVFDTPYTDGNGIAYVSGYVVGSPDDTALGRYVDTANEVQIIVTRGTEQRSYRFGIFDDHRAIGVVAVYDNGVPTTPDPMTATGSRLLYKSELANRIIGGQ